MHPKCCCAVWILSLFVLWNVTSAMESACPSLCTCKWKGGKKTVECMERGLIAIPESVDPETQVLDLSGNNLQVLPRENFIRSGLVNLQRVYLISCRIGQIDDLAFNGLTNLIELDLSHNLLTSVPTESFRSIPLLRDLIISNNPIQKIEPFAFQHIRNLVELDISNCELQTIAPRAFEGIEELELLKLNGNYLTELRLRTVEVLNRLHGVELHDNPWQCDCRLRAVKEWLVRNNIPYPQAPTCGGGPERVIHKTFSELSVDDFACKPDILPVIRYLEVMSGENATITCKANAIPSAHIKWYWNGKQLLNNSDFSARQKIYVYEEGKQEKRSNLVITNVQDAGYSEFYCVAENRAGNAEVNFTVHVSLRPLGITSIGNGEIAGLSAALVILILFILVVISLLLPRLRRIPFVESKTPAQMEVVNAVTGENAAHRKASISPINPSPQEIPSLDERKNSNELYFPNDTHKPPSLNDILYSSAYYNGNSSINPGSCFESPTSRSAKNPDLINDTKVESGEIIPIHEADHFERRASGEYSRNLDSLYPSGLWRGGEGELHIGSPLASNSTYLYRDAAPIIAGQLSSGKGSAEEELGFRTTQEINRFAGYPSDYGLPVSGKNTLSRPAAQVNLPTDAKTLRVWQKGAVPVLPPVTALKRALLNHNRNSPDEGYQEGGCTDV